MSRGRKFRLTAMAILAVAAFAQPPQPGPWSEQVPYPQGPPPQGPLPPRPQNGPQGDDDGNAPDRGVARLSYVNGNVSVRRGDSADMVAAVLNAPLTVGDRLVTGDGGRAEVQLDYANIVRLGPSSEVRFSELQRGRYQIQIAAGTAAFRVLRDSDAQVEISTPSMSVHPLRKGVYRIDVKPDGVTEITLRGGAEGEAFGPRGSEEIHNNSMMMVRGSSNDPEFQIVVAPAEDDFDHWSASRDQYMERSTTPNHVSRDVYGTEDMDQYGRWTNDGSYGQVWVPQVAPGWAPYSCGRWTWVDYYGWTWVGCEPWGWAPYHYGRWYYGGLGWAWWPGPIYSPYFWRPALVGFFGWGAPGFGIGVGFGFGFGHVGWVPLAPFERFHPWYGAAGLRGGAVVNNINVTNVYRNARVANGVSSVNAGEFGRGGVSSANMIHAPAAELAHAGTVNGRLPMTPSAESRQFTNRSASTQGMPRTSENTHFFSNNRTSTPSNGGWQRMSPSGSGTSNVNRSAQKGGSQTGGWQRFEGSNRGTSGSTQSGVRNSYSPSGSQPQVRINPPIVQSRGAQGSNGSSRPSTNNARPSGGGSRGGGGGSRGGGGGHGGGGGRH